MSKTTRFRFSASAIERLSCPDGTKAVEVSDADGVNKTINKKDTNQ